MEEKDEESDAGRDVRRDGGMRGEEKQRGYSLKGPPGEVALVHDLNL